jgi:hypothetical protein
METIFNMRARLKSYAEEDEELSTLDFDKMSSVDVDFYFRKYLDNGNGQGHL